jgi:hypothetical protein
MCIACRKCGRTFDLRRMQPPPDRCPICGHQEIVFQDASQTVTDWSRRCRPGETVPPGSVPSPVDSGSDGPGPWRRVVGGAAAVAAAALTLASAAAGALSRAGKRSPNDADQGPIGYVLQLSADRLVVTPSAPATLTVAAWAVDARGGHRLAPDVGLRIDAPAGSGVRVTPAEGRGRIDAAVALDGTAAPSQTVLTVTGASSAGPVTAEVTIECGLVLRAFVLGSPTADVYFDANARRWAFPEVIAFYAVPGEDRPVRPDFQYGFPSPALQFDPPVLGVVEACSHDGGLSWTFKTGLLPGVDLEAAFGPDLDARDGLVRASLRAGRAGGAWDEAAVAYRLRPQLRVVAYGYDRDPARRGGRDCRGLALTELELVADGIDRLPLAAVLVRTDREVRPGGEWAARSPFGEIVEPRLEGTAAGDYTLEPGPVFEAGGSLFTARATRPLLLTPARSRETLSARFVPRLARSAPAHYALEPPAAEPLLLRPHPVFLKLWVVPGGKPGTSEAAAFACVPPHAGRPLPGLPLELAVEGGGAASLTVESASRATTDARGLSRWTLRYSGLSWSSLPGASWRVKCGSPDGEGEVAEATEVRFDVAANVAALLADIQDERASARLDLENPELSLAGRDRLGAALDYAVPDFLSGPAINFAVMIGENLGSADAAAIAQVRDRYVCGALSHRIFEWMAHRRFGAEWSDDAGERARMNGIEIDQYAMYFLGPVTHHFAGITLSGTGPDEAPRFVDPWWRQAWEDPAYRSAEGLLTPAGETTRGIAAISAVALLVILTAKILVTLMPSLGVLAATRMVKIWVGMHLTAVGNFEVFRDTSQTNFTGGVYGKHSAVWAERAVERLLRVHPAVTAVEPSRPWVQP